MNAVSSPTIETDTGVPQQLRDCAELAALGMELTRAVARKALDQLGQGAPAPETGKVPDYVQIFLRLGNLLRQVRQLQVSLTTGQAPRSRAKRAPQLTDARRDLLRQGIDFAVGEGAERASQRRTAYNSLDLHLAADPAGEKRAAAVLHAVLDPMGVTLSFSKMPSALREALTGKT